jgi:hypothetical protein
MDSRLLLCPLPLRGRHVNIVALGTQKEPVVWVGLLALLPLALLLLTGLYLFVLPYTTKWRSGRRTGVRGTVLE